MLDSRVESFLAVCKHRSYTKAAEELFITQPAITQHIQYLSNKYSCKLFNYTNKEVELTNEGELLYKYLINAKAIEKVMIQELSEMKQKRKTLKFAATLTISEFTLSPFLSDFIQLFNEYNITLYVDNTKQVLKMLQNGEISFALVEGLFNKAEYESRLCKLADFILIAPNSHPLAKKEIVEIKDLSHETIIMRELGSGSREVLERGLYEKNYTLDHFKNKIEIGNVNVIKNMVKSGMGLSFMYKDAVIEEIKNNQLVEIKLRDFEIKREFNFIYLKNVIYETEINRFYAFIKNKMT